MCGRYRLSRHKEILEKHFEVEIEDEVPPRYNVSPTEQVATVRQDARRPVRGFGWMRWGLIPYWAKDGSGGAKMINARAETAATKPAFREALRKRRCLIPADGFYEWKKIASGKQPYCFTMADEGVFCFAGIWDAWKDAEGRRVETCSILTTTPNRLVQDIHDRMPVILRPEDYETWLDPGEHRTEAIAEMLRPFDAEKMRRSALVGRLTGPELPAVAGFQQDFLPGFGSHEQ